MTEVIGPDNDLESFLRSVKNRRIDIAVAFASKTETLIDAMLNNGNTLYLTIGTINYFSDPVFIEYCRDAAQKAPSRFNFSVDFGGNKSLHWKLYLIAPDIVIIGSSNLTALGLSMQRDTAVRIMDKQLDNTYRKLLATIRKRNDVIEYNAPRFDEHLADYVVQHRTILAKPRPEDVRRRDRVKLPSFSKWLEQETTQMLPVFIWYRDFTRRELKLFREEIQPKIASLFAEDKRKQPTGQLHPIGTYNGSKNIQHYHNDDLILEMSSTGAYVRFELAEFVIYEKGAWWLCRFRGKRIPFPFDLSPALKAAIKQEVKSWAKVDKAFLNSQELRQLEKISRGQ